MAVDVDGGLGGVETRLQGRSAVQGSWDGTTFEETTRREEGESKKEGNVHGGEGVTMVLLGM